MNSRLLKQALAMFFFVAADCASAQTTPVDIIDSQKPPAGFVTPKPAEARDLSMAKYARESYLAGEEGVVALRVLVRRDGSVGDAQIALSSGSARLDQSAQDVVRDWRYVPATVSGAPVDSWVPVNIIWALQTLRYEMSPDQANNMGAYYPKASIRSQEQGTSTVRFFVSPDGTVTKTVIEKSSGHLRLDDATMNMLKFGFHFTPGTLPTGETAGTWFRLAFTWTLSGSGQRSKDDDACFAPDGTSSADMVIVACTQFLTNPNLTGYQRAVAYEARGDAHRSKRELDEAIADYDRGIRISPGLSGLHIGRARAHLAKGEMNLAFSDFDSGVYVEPLNFYSYIARAEAYFKAGQQDRAATDLDRAMRVTSTSYQAYARCLYFTRIGKPQDGLVECNKAVTLLPRESQNLNNRGIAYLKLGQYERAIQDYDAALRINARLAPSLYGRGVAKLKRSDAKGESDLKAAKAIDPMIGDRMAEYGVTP